METSGYVVHVRCITSVIDTRVQFDHHRSPNYLLQEVARGLLSETHLDCDLKRQHINCNVKLYGCNTIRRATLALAY